MRSRTGIAQPGTKESVVTGGYIVNKTLHRTKTNGGLKIQTNQKAKWKQETVIRIQGRQAATTDMQKQHMNQNKTHGYINKHMTIMETQLLCTMSCSTSASHRSSEWEATPQPSDISRWWETATLATGWSRTLRGHAVRLWWKQNLGCCNVGYWQEQEYSKMYVPSWCRWGQIRPGRPRHQPLAGAAIGRPFCQRLVRLCHLPLEGVLFRRPLAALANRLSF